jgi:hypothetical protein
MMDAAKAEAQVSKYANLLQEARARSQRANIAVKASRTALGQALRIYMNDGRTPEQNVREWIASNQAERAALAAGEMQPAPGPTPGPSHLDKVRMAGGRGGSVDKPWTGGHHRGAYPARYLGRRVPSER